MVVDLPDLIGNFGNEVPVVAHHDQGALVTVERIDEQVYRVHVEVVGRLIQHEEVCLAHDGLGQCHTGFLTTAEHFDLLVCIISAEEETTKQGAQFQFCLL